MTARSQLTLLVFVSMLALRGLPACAQDVLPDIPAGDIAIHLDPIVTGFGAPDYAISPPGDLNRLFVVEQKGTLLVVDNGSLLATPGLDLQSRISTAFNPGSANDERGFLGLAFHPGFNTPASPGFNTLYTYSSEPIPEGTLPTYSAPNGATQNYRNVINEWKMSGADPNVVDPASRREIISFGKNAGNHNGGTIAFGPDGYLYLALGDGGNSNDSGASHIEPGGNAQNLSTPLGKMLRIDPLDPALTTGSSDPASPNGQYRVPTTNPFQDAGEVPEIYAYGFRNPYRFAFDPVSGDLIMADVGQNTIEEINRVVLGGNYGWVVKEGTFLFNRTGPDAGTVGADSPGVPADMIDPISGPLGTLEYDHGDGIAITGGFVYRGSAIPELYGKYVFGDLAIRELAAAGGRPAVLRRPRQRRDQGILAATVRQRKVAERSDGPRLWPGRTRRTVRRGDQHAVQRHGRHPLQARGGAGAGDAGAAHIAVGSWSRRGSRRRGDQPSAASQSRSRQFGRQSCLNLDAARRAAHPPRRRSAKTITGRLVNSLSEPIPADSQVGLRQLIHSARPFRGIVRRSFAGPMTTSVLPTISFSGTQPKNRLSRLARRLSPRTKYSPLGTTNAVVLSISGGRAVSDVLGRTTHTVH